MSDIPIIGLICVGLSIISFDKHNCPVQSRCDVRILVLRFCGKMLHKLQIYRACKIDSGNAWVSFKTVVERERIVFFFCAFPSSFVNCKDIVYIFLHLG